MGSVSEYRADITLRYGRIAMSWDALAHDVEIGFDKYRSGRNSVPHSILTSRRETIKLSAAGLLDPEIDFLCALAGRVVRVLIELPGNGRAKKTTWVYDGYVKDLFRSELSIELKTTP